MPKSVKKPPQELIDLGKALLMAKAFEECIKAQCIPLQQKILDENDWHIDIGESTGEGSNTPIRCIDEVNLLCEEDLKQFNDKKFQEYRTAGLNIKKSEIGFIDPYSEAKYLRTGAEMALVSVADTIQAGLSKLLEVNPQKKDEYIELTLRLITPFVDVKEEMQSLKSDT